MLLVPVVLLAPANVSFSAPAETASQLLPELGKALGLRLEAGPRVAREVLLVSVKDVPTADLFRRLAQATGGEWEQRDDVYRLEVPSGLDAREARAERIERGTALLATARRQAEQRGKKMYSDGQNGVSEAVVASLSPEFLGGLGFKQRVVFSTRPTAMQRPLTRAMLAGIDLARMGRNVLQSPTNVEPPASGTPAIVQFTVQIDENGTMLRHSLLTADASGRVLRAEAGQIWGISYATAASSKSPTLPRPSETVRLGKEARERAVLFHSIDAGRTGYGASGEESLEGSPMMLYSQEDVSMPPMLRGIPEVLQPESREPLAFFAGPLLEGLAKGQGLNVVADLPDSAFRGAAGLLARSEMPASAVVQNLRTQAGTTVEVDGAWMVARPSAPARARANRLDRVALGTALRRLAKDGALGLDARADYAAAAPLTSGDEAMDAPLFAAVNPEFGKRIATSCGSGERQLLRIYRMLGSGRPREPRPFGSLPSAAREAITTLVFNATQGPSRRVLTDEASARYGGWQSGDSGFVPVNLGGERTVYWANGVPPRATFRCREDQEPMIFGLAPNGARPRMTPYNSGYGMRSQGNGPMVVSTSHPRLEKYAKGSLLRVLFELEERDAVRFARVLDAESIPADAPVIPYDGLPEALRKSIEQGEEGVRRMIEDNQRPQPQLGGKGKVKP